MNNNLKPKQELLFLSRTLGRAGVGVSLVSVLQNIDYSIYNVTLGIQYPEKELQAEIPDEVKIIYYGEITSNLYGKIFELSRKLGEQKKNPIKRFFWHLLNKLEACRMVFKVRKCFKKTYDTANAYHQGMASKYVMKHIRAKKKILWYHASVIEQPWYKKLFAKADEIVINTEKGKHLLTEAWGDRVAHKITVIPCLMSFADIIKKSNEPIGTEIKKGKKYFVLTCGRLTYEKGMDLVIEAAKIVKERTENFVWAIIGEGPLKQSLKTRIEQLALSDTVALLGYFKNPYPFLKHCDIYVSPSKLESYGLTMVEALIFGKPIVTTKTVGGTTIIKDGHNGLHVDMDANSIAQAVLTLMEDEKLREELQKNIENTDLVSVQNQHVERLNQLQNHKNL